MKEVTIKARQVGTQDWEAVAIYEGKVVDSHVHSSEGWLLSDWGLIGNDSHHHKKISEIVGEPYRLEYQSTDFYGKELFIKEIS